MENFSIWLNQQDISVQYIYGKLVFSNQDSEKQKLIATQGYGQYFLSKQNVNGHWGKYYYQPKWTSTHYTLLQLKDIGMSQDNLNCVNILLQMFDECQLEDGGLNLAKSKLASDICVDGMILNYASYFLCNDTRVKFLLDSILRKQKKDGGFTWHEQDIGDPHSTICVLEGLVSFCQYFHTPYRQSEVERAINLGLQYFYDNQLFFTMKDYQKNIYPFRYFYTIFRFLLLAASLNLKDCHIIKETFNWFLKKEPTTFIKLDKDYKGEQFIHFSKKGEVNPFLTVYSEFIKSKFK